MAHYTSDFQPTFNGFNTRNDLVYTDLLPDLFFLVRCTIVLQRCDTSFHRRQTMLDIRGVRIIPAPEIFQLVTHRLRRASR
jgi:hypothetical protein